MTALVFGSYSSTGLSHVNIHVLFDAAGVPCCDKPVKIVSVPVGVIVRVDYHTDHFFNFKSISTDIN